MQPSTTVVLRSVMRTVIRTTTRALLALALVAPVAAAQTPRFRVKLRAFPMEVALDTLVFNKVKVGAPMGPTFAALRDVYSELKLPKPTADSANGQLAVLRLVRTYTIGNERMSVYFNCGTGLTGANADTWRLTIALASYTQPAAGDSTTVSTGIVAQAEDMGGASKEPVMCGSTGLLETRIATMVKERTSR
jgi:hypothetical protein